MKSEISLNHLNPEIFKPKCLDLSESIDKPQWEDIHRTVLTCSRASRAWLKQSRDFAQKKWGAYYVAEYEIQLELALGFLDLDKPEKLELNPADKTKAIVTIEGISQQFVLWHRKMKDEITNWDRPRLEKALDLLSPIEAQAKAIRERLEAIG